MLSLAMTKAIQAEQHKNGIILIFANKFLQFKHFKIFWDSIDRKNSKSL